MFYLFIILGTLTLAGSLVGLINAIKSRARAIVPLQALSLGLVAVAWWSTHETNLGQICLLAGAAVQVIAWFSARVQRPQPGATASKTRKRGVNVESEGPVDAFPPPTEETAPASRSQPDEDALIANEWTPEKGEIAAARAKASAAAAPVAPRQRDDSPPNDSPGLDRNFNAFGVGKVYAQPRDESTSNSEDEDAERVTPSPGEQPAEETPALSLRSEVLFTRACTVPPAVFVASLRRNGRRDASAADDSPDADPCVRIGDVLLEYKIESGPRDSTAIDETLAHFEQSPDVAERVKNHASRVILTSRYGIGTPRDLVVRLHHHAHAALPEFAPVIAAFWPDARMLTPLDQLPGLLEYARSPAQPMWRTCTHIRGFALAGENEGMFLFDSVGLHAFGLPDVQVIAPAAEEYAARATIDLITQRIFNTGCDLPHGTEFTASDSRVWRVNYTRSAFVPDREVVQLALKT